MSQTSDRVLTQERISKYTAYLKKQEKSEARADLLYLTAMPFLHRVLRQQIEVFMGLKNKPVLPSKDLGILQKQPNRATLRSDPARAVR